MPESDSSPKTLKNILRYCSLRRISLSVGSLIFALLIAAGAWSLFGDTPSAQAFPQETASVIVQFNDTARVGRPLSFSEPISGFAALQQSGLSFVYTDTSFGPAICSIEGVGCPSDDCFCSTKYWGYNYWDGSAWQGYPFGSASSVISQTGAIEGWRWGEFGDPMASPTSTLAALGAINWIGSRQGITTGGFGNMAGGVEVMLAIGSNAQSGAQLQRTSTSNTLADFTAENGAAYSRSSASASGKLFASLAASDGCFPLGAVTPSAYYSSTLGTYAAGTGDNAWAILGANAISESVPASAISQLKGAQQVDGGWEWSPGWGSDSNATALALQALVANNVPITSTTIVSAVAFLKSTQQADGGFAYAPGPAAESDANSTAYVIQALVAAGEDPEGAGWTQGDNSPISFLLNLQLPEGAFEWIAGTGANALATTQAVPALLGQFNPIAIRTLELCPATFLPVVELGALTNP